jgi:hypothetical protein
VKIPHEASLLRRQAVGALLRARTLPSERERNNLRQLAVGLLSLEKRGLVERAAKVLAVLHSQARHPTYAGQGVTDPATLSADH